LRGENQFFVDLADKLKRLIDKYYWFSVKIQKIFISLLRANTYSTEILPTRFVTRLQGV